MNEQGKKQDDQNDSTTMADLDLSNAEDIKGGMLDAGRVRVSSSSGC